MDQRARNGMSRRGVVGLPAAMLLAPAAVRAETPKVDDLKPYASLLETWCDGLVSRQVRMVPAREGDGGFLCPGCGMIHGRVADSVYPLLRAAKSTGQDRYVGAALAVQAWSERTVTRPDGSWVNDVFLNDWKGTTVFRVIALCEALLHHGDLLDRPTKQAWTARLAAALSFLEGFMTLDTGNINYPISSAYAFALGAEVLGKEAYAEKARYFAHASLDYFTPNGLLFGEGHPQRAHTAKGRPPVDLGYNVEESLPALALYALHTGDAAVTDQVVASLRAHMEFMLPDGAWDNSWGTRNFKWTWWGSRTSDGCHAAYRLMADRDPRFAEVSARNLALMAACTHDGLLHGGPDYRAASYRPCLHHTFSHASALASVLDLAKTPAPPSAKLPREAPYGLKPFPEIGTHLASVGPWRATFTDYDFDYLAPSGGGHASGGAISILYHQALGPVLAASMTRYKSVEISNQQVPIDATHETLTARIERREGKEVFTSLCDFAAHVAVSGDIHAVRCDAGGKLLTPEGKAPAEEIQYTLAYKLTEEGLALTASIDRGTAQLVLPIIAKADQGVEQADARTVTVAKCGGRVIVKADAGLRTIASERIFNLVPGLQAARLTIDLTAGRPVRVLISA